MAHNLILIKKMQNDRDAPYSVVGSCIWSNRTGALAPENVCAKESGIAFIDAQMFTINVGRHFIEVTHSRNSF